MTITLPPELEKFVADEIRQGTFQSPEHAVAEAFRLMRERDQKLAELRREIMIGVEQLDRGEMVDGPTAMAELIEKSRRRAASVS